MKNKENITAIIYDKKGRILSIGKNSYIKTHPLQKFYAEKCGLGKKIYIHAELQAIIRCHDLEKAHKIIISRIGKTGNMLLAAPCPICQMALRGVGIAHIEHT
jgi:tRNA(Arg) A34 adenosine deaminase TadA